MKEDWQKEGILKQIPLIYCKKCRVSNEVSIEDFPKPTFIEEERKISYEREWTWSLEISCRKCKTDMNILINAYEYPLGYLSYVENNSSGCSFESKNVKVEIE